MALVGIETINLFKGHGSALVDEFDTVASTRHETIFAGGDEVGLNPQHVSFVKGLYQKMVKSDLVKLRENNQHLLPKEDLAQLQKNLLTPTDDKDISDLMNEQIDSLLPLTLSKQGGVNYGPSIEHPDSLYCIPYGASQKPKRAQNLVTL